MSTVVFRMRLKQIHGVAVENLPSADGQNFDPAKFKLLLNHRKLELQGSQQPPFPFLPGFNPAALGLSGLGAKEGGDSGLDLRFKMDEDLDEEMSDAGSDRHKEAEEDKHDEQKSPNPRSRRKPAAPQWVNPEWEETPGDNPPRQQPINGVCVRNIAAFGTEENAENIAEDETS